MTWAIAHRAVPHAAICWSHVGKYLEKQPQLASHILFKLAAIAVAGRISTAC
jgi:hypothetical protein